MGSSAPQDPPRATLAPVSHLSRGGGGGLLSCASVHHLTGRTLADGVHRRHPEVVVGVGAEPADAVARGGDAVDLLVRVLGAPGAMLERRPGHLLGHAGKEHLTRRRGAARRPGSHLYDVVGHRFGVPGVPGESDACRCPLRHQRRPRSLGQSWGEAGAGVRRPAEGAPRQPERHAPLTEICAAASITPRVDMATHV